MAENPTKYAKLHPNPYDCLGTVMWHTIEKWTELDFVKALPDDIKQLLIDMPPEAEVEYEYCQMNQKMMPRLNPFRSRAYWLKHYNELYQPIREKNAKYAVLHAQAAFCQTVERSLAHISEVLELLNQNTKQTQLQIKQLTEMCEDIWEYDSSMKSGKAPPWV